MGIYTWDHPIKFNASSIFLHPVYDCPLPSRSMGPEEGAAANRQQDEQQAKAEAEPAHDKPQRREQDAPFSPSEKPQQRAVLHLAARAQSPADWFRLSRRIGHRFAARRGCEARPDYRRMAGKPQIMRCDDGEEFKLKKPGFSATAGLRRANPNEAQHRRAVGVSPPVIYEAKRARHLWRLVRESLCRDAWLYGPLYSLAGMKPRAVPISYRNTAL